MATIHFLGGAGTVTGSMFMVKTAQASVLVDCGLFQGPKELKARNWHRLPTGSPAPDAVLLTHAHLDHSGYLPRLVADGYRGPVYCTPATVDLLGVLLPDSGHLQEEEARHANRKGWSRHKPAAPLYTLDEATRSLRSLRPVPFGAPTPVAPGVTATFRPAGHILGSASIELTLTEGGRTTTVVFSGDVGRSGAPLLQDPAPLVAADYVVVESTYGDRLHPGVTAAALAHVIRDAAARGGMLLLPAFAVGRTQELLAVIRELEDADQIPVLDVFVDSPMALDATAIMLDHLDELDEETAALVAQGIKPLQPQRLHLVRDADASRALNPIQGPGIILSASGMCTGGRIKHHLRHRLPDPRSTVCFVGFQAIGTRGRQIAEGAKVVNIFGDQVPVRATIAQVEGFSAHADRDQLVAWLATAPAPPHLLFIAHGEPEGATGLAEAVAERLGWPTAIPALDSTVDLAARGAVTPV